VRVTRQAAVTPTGKGPSQRARKAIILLAIALAGASLFIATSRWPEGGLVHELIEWTGMVLIGLCVAGRTWCSLYIGGRKNFELVQDGPYSLVRNPLYVFSIIGAAGAGAQMGSVVAALAYGVVTWAIFSWMARVEEESMQRNFGDVYRDYAEKVPRLWPRLSGYHSRHSLEVYPHKVAVTFFDACLFWVAVPVMEAFDYLHAAGFLPTLLRLP
jgi:protein-S-isoprenylcysteine O-methyltransferase Ste14